MDRNYWVHILGKLTVEDTGMVIKRRDIIRAVAGFISTIDVDGVVGILTQYCTDEEIHLFVSLLLPSFKLLLV